VAVVRDWQVCYIEDMSDVTSKALLVPISREECLTLLGKCTVGRLAVIVDGRPNVVPLNFAADASGVVVFRTAELTVATEASLAHLAFEVDNIDVERREGWSVVVHGFGREIGDAVDPESKRLRQLSVEAWATGTRDRWYKITPGEITGRRLVRDEK
jgi:nitroimidazol reductase NimA-like FMN-containing flavoprotein (pyridoxamine 5'-phosphate oxidase superfamily)